MSFICDCLKLPKMEKLQPISCAKLTMSNGEEYTIKVDDLIGVQFIRDDKRIFVRRGRVKDIVIVNRKAITTCEDNVSRLILDCSEQYSIKIIEIKFSDIIKIAGIDYEFEDYSDRITELEPNYIECNRIPTRQNGMYTKEEMHDKITKPNREDVVGMDPNTGVFNDLLSESSTESETTNKETITSGYCVQQRGFPITR